MRIFGLIGFPLSHSFSKKYFTDRFLQEGYHDCIYENFEIPSISELSSLVQRTPFLHGLNVTIPYKEVVVAFLDDKNEIVKRIGACNCIKLADNKLYGFNTDTAGFEQSLLKNLKSSHEKALILGTGGAAKAIRFVMEKLGISYLNVSRDKEQTSAHLQYDEITDDLLQTHTLIVNTSPLGMYPKINVAPPLNYSVLTPGHYLFDLIYNPVKTLFLQKGEERGATVQNGHAMLIIQAEESWKIWNEL